MQNKVWNSEVTDCRRASITKRKEGNKWEVHGGEGKSMGDSKLFSTSWASLEPLRATLGPQPSAQLESQSHIISSGT